MKLSYTNFQKGEKVLVLKKRHYSKDSHLPTSLSSSDLQHSSERAQSEPPTNVDSVDGAAMSRGKSEGNLDNVSMASVSSSQSIGGSLDLSTSSIASTVCTYVPHTAIYMYSRNHFIA